MPSLTTLRATEKAEELLENIINRLGVRVELLRTISDCSAEEAIRIITRAQEGLEIIGDDLEEVHETLIQVLDND